MPMSRKLIHLKRHITILSNGKLSENVNIYKVHFKIRIFKWILH